MTILGALECAKRELLHCDFDSGIRVGLESEILLSFVLDSTREWLHTWGDREIRQAEFEKFMECVHRRTQGEPIEYITHKASFYGEDFYVDNRVLIPRPETEILVQKAQELIEAQSIVKIGEVGVGSGIISIILGLLCPQVNIIGTDISPEALEVAHINLDMFATSANTLKDRIGFVHTNLFEDIGMIPELLISNPPYIAQDYPLSKNVSYEPHSALFGGEKGDEILKLLIEFAQRKKIKFLACEMGYDQKENLESFLGTMGYECIFYQDLNGLDRGFTACLKQT